MTEKEPSSPEKKVVEQHNHGSGAFVAGHNNGSIRIEQLDAKTKSYLARISKDAPALGKMLRRALQEGAISPDTANQLMFATRSINEDVANSLWQASQRLNEDVAFSLSDSSRRLNEDVAFQMSQAAHDLDVASKRLRADDFSRDITRLESGLQDLERLTQSFSELSTLAGTIERLQQPHQPFGRIEKIGDVLNKTAARIEATVTPPPPRVVVDKRAQVNWFIAGLIIGALIVSYLLQR
ncbi:hypothetical protein ACIRJS_12110 [Streptomyces sp. NPDC102340]|uniref:hypothetical protein n=1 Tax=unclassified Streptomyces TaxID=2593676 RepID=UPI00381F443A